EAVGIAALPAPGVAHHGVEVASGFPLKFRGCLGGIRIALGDVAGTAIDDIVRDLPAARFFKCMDDLKHRISRACSEIVDAESRARRQSLESADVPQGEIGYVNVITNTSAVGSRIIATEHIKALAPSHC